MAFGLTDQGFIAPRAADLLKEIRDAYEQKTGLTIDWSSDVFLGVITAVISDRAGDLSEMLQAVADSRNPDNATGKALDTISAIVGVTRQQATYSMVDLGLVGDSGTVVPAGSEVEGDDGTLWYTNNDVSLATGTLAFVTASPAEKGHIDAPLGTITKINNPVSGWDSVTNTGAANPGRERETDSALRLRRQESLQIPGAGSVNAMRANILQVDGVQAAVVIDNPSDSATVIEGVALDPHSFAVVVYPSLTILQQSELARKIYELAPAGIKSMGPESAQVVGLDGHAKTVRWSIATEVECDVEIKIWGVDAASVEDEIKDKVEEYFDELSVGEPARILALLGVVSDVTGVTSADVTINGSAQDIEPSLSEILVLDNNDVVDG